MPRLCADKVRDGSVLAIAALLMVFFVGLAAFCVDLGYIGLVKGELQTSADAGSLAGASALLTDDLLRSQPDYTAIEEVARTATTQFVSSNKAGYSSPVVNPNPSNDPDGDVVIGYLADPTDPSSQLDFSDPSRFNAVRVNAASAVTAYFSRIWGSQGTSIVAASTAVVSSSIVGFKVTSETGNSKLLPFTVHVDSWNNLGGDAFQVSEDTGSVSAGSDGILELEMFPLDTNSASGNFGTVNIGQSGNTDDLSRQILTGVDENDLSYHGGSLELGSDGTLQLNGDTGISAAMKDELKAIKGQRRVIMLYTQVTGEGSTATFTVVGFVGVRIVDVKLTGALSEKKLIVQPAIVVDSSAVVSNTPHQSDLVYTNARLAR